MSGRYYYCEVTATSEGGEKKVISKTAQVIVQKANYSITNGEKTKYYNILSKAVEEYQEEEIQEEEQ